jgi:hypothetical protein
MTTYGLPRDHINLTELVLEQIRWTAGHVDWLRDQVADLAPEALTWGRAEYRNKTGGDDWGTTDVEKAGIHSLLKLYGEERDRLHGMCVDVIKAGVEERRVRLAESQGALVADVIRGILDDLQLTPEQQQLVPTVVPARLRAIDGGAA